MGTMVLDFFPLLPPPPPPPLPPELADPGLLLPPSQNRPRLPPNVTGMESPSQRGNPSCWYWEEDERRFSSFFTVGLMRMEGNLEKEFKNRRVIEEIIQALAARPSI